MLGEEDIWVQKVQGMLPQLVIKQVVLCRGTKTIQPPKEGSSSRDIPLKITVAVRREDGTVEMDGGLEEWGKMHRYKQTRKGIPSKLSLTAHGISPSELRRFDDHAAQSTLREAGRSAEPSSNTAGDSPEPPEACSSRILKGTRVSAQGNT